MSEIPSMGGVGSAGGASSPGGYSSSLQTVRKFETNVTPSSIAGGSGNRGYINNVAFPGATLTADQSADSGSISKWFKYGLVALAVLILWKVFKP
jgi:hypothetical protein